MTRGNFAIAHIETSIHHYPKNSLARSSNSAYDMVIMGDNGIGSNYWIPEADAKRMAKEIAAFKRKLKAEMMAAEEKFRKGKR